MMTIIIILGAMFLGYLIGIACTFKTLYVKAKNKMSTTDYQNFKEELDKILN